MTDFRDWMVVLDISLILLGYNEMSDCRACILLPDISLFFAKLLDI